MKVHTQYTFIQIGFIIYSIHSNFDFSIANNDDSEDSESHDEEEEDDLEAMETNQTANVNIATATDTTSSYSAPEF